MQREQGLVPLRTQLDPSKRVRPTNHDEAIRAVVGVAREIRVELQDAKVIFGSVVTSAEVDLCVFVIRPWGWKLPMTIRFADVLRAAPVKGMVWEKQRTISMAQMSGIFK